MLLVQCNTITIAKHSCSAKQSGLFQLFLVVIELWESNNLFPLKSPLLSKKSFFRKISQRIKSSSTQFWVIVLLIQFKKAFTMLSDKSGFHWRIVISWISWLSLYARQTINLEKQRRRTRPWISSIDKFYIFFNH